MQESGIWNIEFRMSFVVSLLYSKFYILNSRAERL